MKMTDRADDGPHRQQDDDEDAQRPTETSHIGQEVIATAPSPQEARHLDADMRW
jgi:hypothetical protein